jgi:hypothetical protein
MSEIVLYSLESGLHLTRANRDLVKRSALYREKGAISDAAQDYPLQTYMHASTEP